MTLQFHPNLERFFKHESKDGHQSILLTWVIHQLVPLNGYGLPFLLNSLQAYQLNTLVVAWYE
jgi:hypothetical protein